MVRDTLATYSDAGATTNASEFAPGDTIYFEGDITSLNATTDSVVKVEIYDEATDTLQNTALSTTKSFVANTVTTLYAINSDARVSCVTTSNTTVGEYYAKLTVGAEVLYIGFKVSGTPTTIAFTTTADFDSGTHAGTMAEDDNLYGCLYENFDDLAINAGFTAVTVSGDWAYSSGYAYIASGYGHIRVSDSFTKASMGRARSHIKFSNGGNSVFPLLICDKAIAPTYDNYGTGIAGGITDGSATSKIIYKAADGTLYQWNQSTSAWTTSSVNFSTPNISTVTYRWLLETTATQFRISCFNAADEVKGQCAWVDLSDLYVDTNTLWFISGNTADNRAKTIELIEFALKTAATWTSPAITPPTAKKLKTLTITLSNGSENVNYIDKIEILDSSDDSVIDTAGANKHATVTYTGSDFTYTLDPTFNTAFKIKVYFYNLGTTTLTTASITGTFENLATFRFDGEVFVQ